jgi:hypothetical protein
VTSAELRLVYESEPASPPSPIDAIHGRGAEVATLANLLRSGAQRLVTITGLAGVGKTRLALATAGALHSKLRFAVLWASSDPLYATTPGDGPLWHDQLSITIRTGLDGLFTNSASDLGALDSVITTHPTLLVLDGYAADQIRQDQLLRLLKRCASVRVLVTSSRQLGMYGERVFPLTPLPVPEPRPATTLTELAAVPSVQLLVNHVRECHPEFDLTPANAGAVTGLVRVVDGVPAALRAIASWFTTCEPEVLYPQVLANPADFLTGCSGGNDAGRLVERLRRARCELTGVAATVLPALTDRETDWSVADAAQLTGDSPARCARAVRHLLEVGLVRPATSASRSRFHVINLVKSLYSPDVPAACSGRVNGASEDSR